MDESLRGRSALVTGGSSGIGLEIATALAAAGADVILPVRDRQKGERAVRRIREAAGWGPAGVAVASDTPDPVTAGAEADPAAGRTGIGRGDEPRVRLLDLDLARLASVQALVSRISADGTPIDLLVLNAGVVTVGQGRRETDDGFELNFQTNFLGHAALTLGLLPQLRSAGGRVVMQCSVSTAGMRLPWRDLLGERVFGGFRAYRTSKLALGLFGMELARRSRAEAWGVDVQLCHPGITPGSAIAPTIRAAVPDPVVRWAVRHLGNSPRQAAGTAIAAASAPAARPPRMFVPSRWFSLAGPPRERAPFRSLQNRADAERLWSTTRELLGDRPADGRATSAP